MRKSKFQHIVFLTTHNIYWFLALPEYKKNPKRLYSELKAYNSGKTPTGNRRYRQLIREFETITLDLYPEIWI